MCPSTAEPRFHDLRHTYAAMLIAQQAHPRAIMERMGHSTITVTLDNYGHLFPKLDEALDDALDDVYQASAIGRTGVVDGRERAVPIGTITTA